MSGEICLHNATVLNGFSEMPGCAVEIKDGKIYDVYNEQRFLAKSFAPEVQILDLGGAYIAPGFIDTHIHGIGGFSTDEADPSSILQMSDWLAKFGVTSFIPTIGATPEPQLMAKIAAVLAAMGQETGAKILGIHLEGPFLSPEKIGAQTADGISPVDIEYMERIFEACQGRLINMTVAPELKGMRELALYCLSRGIILQTGHSNATYQQMVEAMQAGIMHITHVFNAMRGLHHREPGVVGAALIHPEISCEFIGDDVHVDPHLLQLLLRVKPLSQLVMITDSLKYSQITPPEGTDLALDGCFYRKSDGVLVGSAISMLEGFRNLAAHGIALDKAVRMACTNPAQIMKQSHKGLLTPGYDADLIVFDHQLRLQKVIIGGQFYKEN